MAAYSHGAEDDYDYDYLFKVVLIYRRLRCRQIEPVVSLHKERVQPRLQVHHRSIRVDNNIVIVKSPDLGHRWPRQVFPSYSLFIIYYFSSHLIFSFLFMFFWV